MDKGLSSTWYANSLQSPFPLPSPFPFPMAGLTTSTFPFKPILYNPHKALFPSSYFFGLGLRLRHRTTIHVPISLSFRAASISAGSAGGGFRRPPEEDPVLDISSIRSDDVRLIDEEQNNVGIVKTSVALQMAEDAELDLVILAPDANPPVVRIMDYNKYRYEQQKKKKVQQKKAGRMDLKELKMGYNIDVHDYSVRLRAAQKFLKDGDKVKVIVNLKGREKEFRNNAIELIKRFQNDIGELASEEAKNFKDRNLFVVLIPKKSVLQKAKEEPKKKEKSAATEVSARV